MGKKELGKTQRWLRLIQCAPLIKKPELLDDISEEPEELAKIFATSIKTVEKKSRLGVVECPVYVGRSMFDVERSSF
jgi:hypothetical protein